MLLGLRNARATYSRVMDVMLSTVKWQYDLLYLDDIETFSRSLHDHLNHTRLVLQLLIDAGFTLKLKKCASFTNTIDYLNLVIRPGQLEVSNYTANAIRELNIPTTVTELRSFLNFCSVFRSFVSFLQEVFPSY